MRSTKRPSNEDQIKDLDEVLRQNIEMFQQRDASILAKLRQALSDENLFLAEDLLKDEKKLNQKLEKYHELEFTKIVSKTRSQLILERNKFWGLIEFHKGYLHFQKTQKIHKTLPIKISTKDINPMIHRFNQLITILDEERLPLNLLIEEKVKKTKKHKEKEVEFVFPETAHEKKVELEIPQEKKEMARERDLLNNYYREIRLQIKAFQAAEMSVLAQIRENPSLLNNLVVIEKIRGFLLIERNINVMIDDYNYLVSQINFPAAPLQRANSDSLIKHIFDVIQPPSQHFAAPQVFFNQQNQDVLGKRKRDDGKNEAISLKSPRQGKG